MFHTVHFTLLNWIECSMLYEKQLCSKSFASACRDVIFYLFFSNSFLEPINNCYLNSTLMWLRLKDTASRQEACTAVICACLTNAQPLTSGNLI